SEPAARRGRSRPGPPPRSRARAPPGSCARGTGRPDPGSPAKDRLRAGRVPTFEPLLEQAAEVLAGQANGRRTLRPLVAMLGARHDADVRVALAVEALVARRFVERPLLRPPPHGRTLLRRGLDGSARR